MYDIFFQPVNTLLNIKPATEKALARLDIKNIRDLLFVKPYSYKFLDIDPDLSKVKAGRESVCTVVVNDIDMPRTSRAPTKIYTSNETGELLLVFFNKIPPFIFAKLKEGSRITISGKIELSRPVHLGGRAQMNHPDFILKEELIKPVQPVYHLTYGIINKQLYSYILDALHALETAVKARVNFGNLCGAGESIIFNNEKEYVEHLLQQLRKLHMVQAPANGLEVERIFKESVESIAALELYANQVSLHNLRSSKEKNKGHAIATDIAKKDEVLQHLGFTLTEGQVLAIREIEADQSDEAQMMRLLQGDVGSGKTLVALLTILNAVDSGLQACLMAPTDLLSVQHYEFFLKALKGIAGRRYQVALLTGKSKIKERRAIKEGLESGKIDILIGTHALFQEQVEFKNLGYVVIDEQHRFGVQQRLDLINKASHPDVLVMTATPIPRSLTLTMFGDMLVSQIKTKPKDRLPIITTTLSIDRKDEMIESLQKKFAENERVYWVCPLIDASDKLLENTDQDGAGESQLGQYSDVTSRALDIARIYPGRGEILHGKIKAKEKDEIMRSFKDGDYDYLVATTVIEVGIDVPEATLIIIENAEKFGLAQLHQLRGRVGRGSKQSHCVLLYNPKNFTKTARERLKIMRDSNDGFYIAEQDLILRGGGEILGTKQSGEPEFFFAELKEHVNILMKANQLANIASKSDFQDFQIKLFAKEQEELVKSG